MTQTIEPRDIQQAEIFNNVDLEQLHNYLQKIRKLSIPSGTTLLSPAVKNHEIYILLEGELRIGLQPDNDHFITSVLPGDCVGELSIIDDRPPSAFVVASGDSSLLAVHRDVLRNMLEVQPQLAANLLKLLVERFRFNNDILLNSFKLQQDYRNKAEHDALTTLHNRNWMAEVFPRQLELSERIGQKVTLMMIDADHFKNINDNFGHSAGDQALFHLARIIRDNLRETDLLVRFGGEEFAALMPGTALDSAHAVAERIRILVAATPVTLENNQELAMSISVGMTQWRAGEELDDLFNRADRALYQAKDNGRNQTGIIQ